MYGIHQIPWRAIFKTTKRKSGVEVFGVGVGAHEAGHGGVVLVLVHNISHPIFKKSA